MSGICYQRSEVKMRQIIDGTSKTYLVGERYINPENYFTGDDFADNSSMFTGFENETIRTTFSPPKIDTYGDWYLVPTRFGASTCSFGSAHSGIFQMAFVDGSIRAVSYEISPELHRCLGNRYDGEEMDLSGL
jgi:hypothetical protein